MREYNQALVIDILKKEYPEVNSRICQLIDESLPDKLNDISLIPKIISSFKSIKGLHNSSWTNRQGSKEISENRDLLLCVIMLFYQPEKVLKMTKIKAKYGVLREMTIELECRSDILVKSLPSVIVAYKAYREFKEEVQVIYELIKTEHKFFQ